MRILVAPDKFKGSLSAVDAAEAMAKGFRTIWPQAEISSTPIADGGEGFAETLCSTMGGEWIETCARDPLGREISARYVWVEAERLAIIDMSETSGLWRLKKEELAPLRANTYGTGQLIRHAAERGAKKIFIGLGGSATTDGGIGMAAALGYNFLTDDGYDLEPLPSHLLGLIRIETEGAIEMPEIVAACDVQSPLLGPRGTATVFGPQKGADARMVVALEEGLRNLADVVKFELGCDHRDVPGAGAAGGIAFGLMSFCGARLCSGFAFVAELLNLEEHIAKSDLVITGEGRLDAQTLEGKGPAGVAELARKHGKVVLAFAGSLGENCGVDELFDAALPIIDQSVELEAAIDKGAEFLERAARRAARLLQIGKTL